MIPQPITIQGRTGTVVYLDNEWHPVPAAKAVMARVLYDDGGSAFFTVQSSAGKLAKDTFNEAQHPREPGGTSEGGQFAETGRSGVATSDPILAQQAKAGIAAVERLIPEAVKTADYTDVPGAEPESWSDVDDAVQDKVREKWYESAYENGVDVDTSYLDKEVIKEVQRDNDEILRDAKKDTLIKLEEDKPFKDPDPTLTVGVEPDKWLEELFDPEHPQFELHRELDPDTLDFGDGEHNPDGGYVELDLEALRFKSGEALTPDEQQLVNLTWDQYYKEHYDQAVTDAFESDSYSERRNEAEQESLDQEWSDMSDQARLELLSQYGLSSGTVEHGEPDNWITGVSKEDDKGDKDYGQTHAVAKQLTELRMDELRKERGLLEEDHALSAKKIIHDVWSRWKTSSSQDLSLSLQLAASKELGGVHRLTPEEVAQAEAAAIKYGGIDTLQAYVRAQWEVTQMVMQKAGQDKVDVYRALMLPGEQVAATPQEYWSSDGKKKLDPPSNITVIEGETGLHGWPSLPTLTFDFNGQKFSVGKQHVPLPSTWHEVDEDTKKQVMTQWEKNVREVIAENQKEGKNTDYSLEQGMKLFEKLGDAGKLQNLRDWQASGTLPPQPIESNEAAIQRRLDDYRDVHNAKPHIRLPVLQLQRAGAQSTTGTASVANEWGGVGKLPKNPVRVVVRIEAPPTSVLSLPVYGENEIEEHETVVVGTQDKWLWDAWVRFAPIYSATPIVQKAERLKPLVIDLQDADRGQPHWMTGVDWSKVEKREYVREPGGTPEGGQFAETGRAGEAKSDPTLATQAKDGIKAVEKLLPEAVKTAHFGRIVKVWSEQPKDIQAKAEAVHAEKTYNSVDLEAIEADLARDIRYNLRAHPTQELADKTKAHLMESMGQGKGKYLRPTGDKSLDFATLSVPDPTKVTNAGYPDIYGYPDIDIHALRHRDGSELTTDEKEYVKVVWKEHYEEVLDEEVENVQTTDKYFGQRHQAVKEEVQQMWDRLPDTQKAQWVFPGVVPPREPDHWVTGVNFGEPDRGDYERTHAIAERLTALRTDQLLEERGLKAELRLRPTYMINQQPKDTGYYQAFAAMEFGGLNIASGYSEEAVKATAEAWVNEQMKKRLNVTTSDMIQDIWNQWKLSSSSGLSLSMQLAAAKELGGVHRLTAEELREAEADALAFGGIPVLQAYVRAQWEVTQTVMKKAGESKVDVYRALVLPSDQLKMTPKDQFDREGKPIAPPTNITVSKGDPKSVYEYVNFDYNGEHFEVLRQSNPMGKRETNEEVVARRLDGYYQDNRSGKKLYTRLPALQLQRAGAQSTTGTSQVANDWEGVGVRPPDGKRVVIRIEAPSTSVLSLPVYGVNTQAEHETVVLGTKDKWLWDAWLYKAPVFTAQDIARKGDMKPLVIDLQAEDRGKPHWMSSVDWAKVDKPSYVDVLKYDPGQPRDPDGRFAGYGFSRVALTSQRSEGDPGHQSNKEVFRHMREFDQQLKALPGVSRVSVKPGVGGWEGGSESMWQIYYKGNGAARKLVAQTAKAFNQDAVLVLNKCGGKDCQPAVELSFQGAVSPAIRETVHKVLVKNGIGGWTWMKRNGKTLLRMVSVPQWGGEAAKHQAATAAVSKKLREDGLDNHRTVHKVKVSVMEREGVNSYDSIIGA